jgi:hypothetical protein
MLRSAQYQLSRDAVSPSLSQHLRDCGQQTPDVLGALVKSDAKRTSASIKAAGISR